MNDFDDLDEKPIAHRSRSRQTQSASSAGEVMVDGIRRLVWMVALILILGTLIYGVAQINSKTTHEFKGLAFYAFVMIALPPALLVYIIASCVDGLLKRR